MIQEKSLFGLEESVPMIIDALNAHVFILSEAGGFQHVDHMKVRATRITVSDVEDHSPDHPGTYVTMTLRLDWLDVEKITHLLGRIQGEMVKV